MLSNGQRIIGENNEFHGWALKNTSSPERIELHEGTWRLGKCQLKILKLQGREQNSDNKCTHGSILIDLGIAGDYNKTICWYVYTYSDIMKLYSQLW